MAETSNLSKEEYIKKQEYLRGCDEGYDIWKDSAIAEDYRERKVARKEYSDHLKAIEKRTKLTNIVLIVEMITFPAIALILLFT